jgi:hypothetical protein
MTMVTAEHVSCTPPGLQAFVGAEAVVRANQDLMSSETAEGVSVSWEPTSVVVAPSGDMAFDYGIATTVLPDGSRATGHYLVVWVREGGDWKIAADIYN